MQGISNLTAWIIACRDDVETDAGGPDQNGKYVGWITLGPESRYRPLLNTEPIYNTKEEAKAVMDESVREIREAVTEKLGCKPTLETIFTMVQNDLEGKGT